MDTCLATLNKAVNIFGANGVITALYDPAYDALCKEDLFKLFVTRIASAAFLDHRLKVREESPEESLEHLDAQVPSEVL